MPVEITQAPGLLSMAATRTINRGTINITSCPFVNYIRNYKKEWTMLKPYVSCFLFFISIAANSQTSAIVIKGGYVIDPKNNLHEVMDVAVADGKIISIAKNIDASGAAQVVNAKGMFVCPGLIDMHTHVFIGNQPEHSYGDGPLSISPDGFTFRNGVTTIVDAGCAGWRNFAVFKKQVIDISQTRVLAFLNIVGEGMRGGAYEQDTRDMDGKMTALAAGRYRDNIAGIKVAHYSGSEWTPVDEAVKAGTLANLPVMIDFGGSNPPLPIEELFSRHLRPGDIFTHCFAQLSSRETLVDSNTKKIKPFVWEARKKGIYFDVGYGGISFTFSQAIAAFKDKFNPATISTDIHTGSMNASMKDLLNIMSKFMAIGMKPEEVIEAVTWTPAKAIKHLELGNLSAGGIADIALLNIREGAFGFYDYTGYKITGSQKLECEMTIKGGKIVYDLNGIATPVIVSGVKK
ncbi:MAG: amidohydrolase/deacetylase family metallohydrolase [Chitinophagaceae bacterium]